VNWENLQAVYHRGHLQTVWHKDTYKLYGKGDNYKIFGKQGIITQYKTIFRVCLAQGYFQTVWQQGILTDCLAQGIKIFC
jgi:hypothetical protein